MNRLLTILFALFLGSLSAQEGLAPITENLDLRPAGDKDMSRAPDNYIYLFKFDTNHLPIIDDFSKDLIRPYTFDTLSPAIVTKVWYWFTVNGTAVQNLSAMYDTSYTYTFNNATQLWDSTPNPVLYVVLYSQNARPELVPSDTDTVWVKPDSIVLNNILVPFHSADTQYINIIDTFKIIPDGTNTIWKDHNALLNRTYHIDPPSYGVVTFDGLDSLGIPYDQTNNPGAYGLADVFTSKPVYLKTKPSSGQYTVKDSIYFSFFYQPQGRGDAPEPQDSLILQFYSPVTKKWNTVWREPGTFLHPFKQVMIKLKDTIYFQDGFQFRFLNYATISGNFDQWNIDYVRLDINRTFDDTIIDDIAIAEDAKSLLIDYSQMPWDHYKASSASWMTDQVDLDIANNLGSDKFMRYNYEVFEDGNNIHTGNLIVQTNYPGGISSNLFDITGFSYPKTNTDSVHSFFVVYYANANPDFNRNNDTIVFHQQFGTQYAYDDGSAENAYFVSSAGAQIAVEYNLAKPDTLRAINIYFPRSYESILDRPFRLKVWKSLEPENLLFESFLYNPRYSGSRDKVIGFELEEPLPVDGTIYIGIEQQDKRVFIGFDKNNNSKDKIFFKVQGAWANTSFEGSVFIRPEFGTTNPWPVSVGNTVENTDIQPLVYPNPANGELHIRLNDGEQATVFLYSVTGSLLLTERGNSLMTIATGQYPAGVYILRVVPENNGWQYTAKIIIKH